MGFVAADRTDDRGVEMKKIAKILFWSVLFVWMIFLQPQNVMAAEADEIIKELDFTDIHNTHNDAMGQSSCRIKNGMFQECVE